MIFQAVSPQDLMSQRRPEPPQRVVMAIAFLQFLDNRQSTTEEREGFELQSNELQAKDAALFCLSQYFRGEVDYGDAPPRTPELDDLKQQQQEQLSQFMNQVRAMYQQQQQQMFPVAPVPPAPPAPPTPPTGEGPEPGGPCPTA